MDVKSLTAMNQPPDIAASNPTVPALTVRQYQCGCWSVVEASGELDIQVVPLMRAHLVDCPSHLIFDLSRVTFMDASGLGILARSLRAAEQARGQVRVVGPTRQVRKMLAITQLDRAMLIFASLEEALAGPEAQDADPGS